ncbi:MAG: MurR/RpiR family transcriptional regulator [Erysipelotrichaceae bacterium]
MAIKTPVLSKLLRVINAGGKKDGNYEIAKAMLDLYHEIPAMTIHEVADRCYVSSASISRFIRMLGYDTYIDFKRECSSAIGIDADYSKSVIKAKKEDLSPIFTRYTNNVIENIGFTLDHIDYAQLNRICEQVYHAKDVAFFGLEFATLIGQHFQIKMASLNKFVKLGISYEEQIAIAQSLQDGAVVIVVSLEGGYFYRSDEVMKILKAKNITLIAFTMNEHLKVAKEVDEIIICNKHNSDTEGRISILYIMELFLMYYAINYQMIS